MRIVRDVEFEIGQVVYVHGQSKGIVVGYTIQATSMLYQVRYLVDNDLIVVDIENYEISTERDVFE